MGSVPIQDQFETGKTRTGADGAYGSAYHVPVLCKAVVSGLVTDPNGVYVDGTLGGGGHTAALLDALGPEGRVIGIDRDADALAEAGRRLASDVESGRLVLARGDFGDLADLVHAVRTEQVDGILLDLGVSSHQLDEPTRGFSFRASGPLDMRMDVRRGESAWDWVNTSDERDLRSVLFRFGEEPKSARIARSIVAAREIADTDTLAEIVRRCVPPPEASKTLARVFQALRIAVNDEMGALERVLTAAGVLVRKSGRLVVISYHSLEDRRVKRWMRYGNFEGKPVRDLMGNLIAPWHEVVRHPIEPEEAEVLRNPRARSARLRIAERR